MNAIVTLLKPIVLSFKNRGLSKHDKNHSLKLLIFGTLGAAFWGGLFVVSLRVLGYLKGMEKFAESNEIQLFGDILAYKFLSLILMTSFALLIFSSILTSLSILYLSKDLLLVHSLPIPAHRIYIARWIDSTAESSWMVIVYTLPIFLAYGTIYGTGIYFFLNVLTALLSLAATASALSSVMVMATVMLIPANRMKSIFIFLGLSLFLILYMAFRLLKPEMLADPENFATFLIYLKALKTANPPYLPSTWTFDSIKAALSGNIRESLFHLSLSWSFSGVLLIGAVAFADAFYFKGLSKTQTAQPRLFKPIADSAEPNRLIKMVPSPIRAFAVKEIKTFFRDQTQWTQLFLIAGLVVIYIYNFTVLPFHKSPINPVYLKNLLSFLNMGLAMFVLIAITARFAFPAVSMEGEAFWIVKSSPVSLKRFLWIKFLVYYIPLLFLSELLIVITNQLLDVTPFMMMLSSLTVFLMVPGVVSMGIGFGAAYPDFKAENPTQTVSGFGGIMFMIVCTLGIGTVIVLEAGPVYTILMADLRGTVLTLSDRIRIFCSFALAFAICVFLIVLPMRFGEQRLMQQFE